MKKNLLFRKLVVFTGLLVSLSCNTFANSINETVVVNPTSEEIELSQMHEQAKNAISKGRLSAETITEFDLLLNLRELSEEELAENGYTSTQIETIKSDNLEDTMREAIFERAELPEDTLDAMGYTAAEIEFLKNLSGDESINELSRASANMTVYTSLGDHRYESSIDTTYFIVYFGWYWDKRPVWQMTDCLGLGWNQDFHVAPYGSTYNIHYKKYKKDFSSSASSNSVTTKVKLVENNLNVASDTFDVNGGPNGTFYAAAEGYGTMALAQTGLVNNAKFTAKYAHTQVIPSSPSVSYPWGVGFGFTNADVIFKPTEVLTSATATIK